MCCPDAISAGLDFEEALQDPEMVKLQASQQVSPVYPAPGLKPQSHWARASCGNHLTL